MFCTGGTRLGTLTGFWVFAQLCSDAAGEGVVDSKVIGRKKGARIVFRALLCREAKFQRKSHVYKLNRAS